MIDCEERLHWATKHVVVAFAGGPQNVFQFGASLERLKVNHVLMRDSDQRYYAGGIKGIGDRAAVLKYLRDLRKSFRLVTTGVSSGAYVALLYGQLTPVDRMVVFSPLTGRDTDDFPPEWHDKIYDPANPDMDDLRKYFPVGPIPETRAFISDVYPSCYLDRQMCTRIGIEPELIPGYEHGDLARGMRDRGVFAELFGG